MISRRAVMLGLGAAVAWPLAARAQQNAMPVIGLLSTFSPEPKQNTRVMDGFRQGLGELGYVDGQNVAIEYRWTEGHDDRLPGMAADLVDRQVAVIAAINSQSALAAKSQTATIPIVFYTGADPVEQGLVKSYARPGGNITGVRNFAIDLDPKRLELLHDLVPNAVAFGLLVDPHNPNAGTQSKGAQNAAQAAHLKVAVLRASSEAEVETVFAGLSEQRIGGVIVGGDAFFSDHAEGIASLAARHAVPVIYNSRHYVAAGGLISYGNDPLEVHRPLGNYVGRILKGAKPADLPVLQPTRVELVINLKTTKSLGLTVPQSLFALADEIIE
jgi:putative tryptophan/tyrosine transport system substrate-binding protein